MMRLGGLTNMLAVLLGAGPALAPRKTTLPSIVGQWGELQEINFGIDLAELNIVRTTAGGTEQFMLYMLRSEDGIWRFDGM